MSVENKLGGTGELNGRKRRFATSSVIALAVGLVAFAGMAQRPAHAADDQQLQLLSDQIRQLQAQIDALKKTQAMQAAAATPAPPAGTKPAIGYETGSHQFGWASADGQNSIELTGRVHFDAGAYTNYKPDAGLTNPRQLVSGVNVRRARLGVTGKFAGDFSYAFIADFGGSSDSDSPFVSGAGASLIENAFITYNGFNKPDHTVPLAFDVGYLDVPVTLDEATSSNDMMFMEHPSSQVIATSFGGSDARSAFGARSYKSDYFGALYVTGPTAGAPHNNPSTTSSTTQVNSVPSGQPLAFLGRATYNPWQDAAGDNIHVGVNGSYVVNPGSTTSTTVAGATSAFGHSMTLSDRPELRIDPTSLLSTGTISNVQGAQMVGGELAGQVDHFFADGEYYEYYIDRYQNAATSAAPLPNLNFNGGYAQASWSFGGKRKYNASTGAYTGVIPDAPLSLSGSGWGALEVGARISYVDLNDHVISGQTATSTGGVAGGQQTAYTFGVNYYPNTNIKLMLEYLHADISKNSYATTTPTANGATVDAIAGRFQVAW